jgi:tetratricopeptide (TPR) repeat protein
MAAVLVIGIYWNGLQGPFVLDDYSNILRVPGMAVQELSAAALRDAVYTYRSPYLDRPLARLSLALNHYLAGGFEVLHFKLTNVAIHLLSALVIWLLGARLLVRHAVRNHWPDGEFAGRSWWHWAAFLCAVLWAVHPLHVSTVLYIVQRMTSLSALFVLLGAYLFVVGRERIEAGRPGGWALIWGGVAGGAGLGALCKENAVLLPFLVALIEWTFFDRERLAPGARRALRVFYAVAVLVPAAVALGALALKWDAFAEGFRYRPYSMAERLLTQGRGLWFYLSLLAVPGLRRYGIHHDDFAVSHGLFDPWTTALALAAWLVVIVLATVGLRRRSLLGFAVFWYLIGHSIESSVLNLEMLFEHRNYLPSVGPVIAFVGLLLAALASALRRPRAAAIVGVVLVVTFSGVTFARANTWESQYLMAYFGVRNHPQSPRYRRAYAAVLYTEKNASDEVFFEQLQIAARLQPQDLSALYDMAGVVDRRLLARGEPPAWNVPRDAGRRAVAVLSTPLSDDIDRLSSLARAIDREIRRRARDEVLTADAIELGQQLQACVGSADPHCSRMLAAGAPWLELIVDSPRLLVRSRGISALSLARVLAYTGDVDGAIEALHRAQAIMPDAVDFRFHEATLMLTLGRFDEADAALDQAAARIHPGAFGVEALSYLREQVRAAREQRAPAAAGPGRADGS